MITGIGEPGTWNGQHFRSPTILDFGDYLLLAMEGWEDDSAPTGIGLMIGVERWLKAKQQTLVISQTSGEAIEAMVGNYGAGDLTVTDIKVVGNGFILDAPDTPFTLKSSEEFSVNVSYGEMEEDRQGLVVIKSDAQLGDVVIIELKAL